MNVDFAIDVGQLYLLNRAVKAFVCVYARPANQAGEIRDPLFGIVVAADHENADAARAQAVDEIIEQGHRLRLRRGFLVNVARNQNAVYMLVLRDLDDLIQNEALILQQGKVFERLSDVQIRNVHQFHA